MAVIAGPKLVVLDEPTAALNVTTQTEVLRPFKAAVAIGHDLLIAGVDKVAGVVTERWRIAAGSVLCAGGACASMVCRRRGIDLLQAGTRSTVFVTSPGPEVTPGGLVIAGPDHQPPARWRLQRRNRQSPPAGGHAA